jgi:hypothetical protein
VARAQLGRIQVSGGVDHGRAARKGAGWGALLVGVPILLSIVQERSSGGLDTPEAMVFSGVGLIGGTAVGAAIGAVIGGIVGSERWLTLWEWRADQ